MKKSAVLLISLFFAAGAAAQGLTPQTTVEVTVKVRKESIVMGPYARYAQKYLGVAAPLNSKTVYTVEGVSFGTRNFEDKTRPDGSVEQYDHRKGPLSKGNKLTDGPAPAVDYADISLNPIVTSSGIEKSDAELAKNAAEAIFTLRKRRFDMITGEYGDGVFGAGLGAAIEEMKRLENEYLKLFVGKTYVEEETYVFTVTPEKGRERYIICRFSDTKGILPNVDITGEPVVLVMRDLELVRKPAAKKKDGNVKAYPDLSECSLYVGTEKAFAQNLEVYQFGEIF